jgi:hypothetical protein
MANKVCVMANKRTESGESWRTSEPNPLNHDTTESEPESHHEPRSRIKKGKAHLGHPLKNKPSDYIFGHPTTIINHLPNEFEAEVQQAYLFEGNHSAFVYSI